MVAITTTNDANQSHLIYISIQDLQQNVEIKENILASESKLNVFTCMHLMMVVWSCDS
jgi:hypothetical protein